MIKIGVTDNVYLSDQKKNEKGTLEVTITEAGTEKKKLSLMDRMGESSDESAASSGTTMMLFMPSREYQNEQIAPEKQVQNLMKFKDQLHHFLKRYVAETQLKWSPLKGIILKDDNDLLDKIQTEETYVKIYTNIVDQFIEQAERFKVNNPEKKSRILLIRQSKEKSFGRLRDNYLKDRPFWESMDIPKENSKMYVKAGSKGATTFFEPDADGYVPNFDPYEITKGFDNPIISSTKADSGSNTPEEAAAVESVFGQQPQEAIDFSAPAAGFGIPDQPSEVPGLSDLPTIENGGLGEGVKEG